MKRSFLGRGLLLLSVAVACGGEGDKRTEAGGGMGGSAGSAGTGGGAGIGGSGGASGAGGSTAYSDEGAPEAPLEITGMLPYDGQVSQSGTSYYRITGATPDAIYTITLSRTDGLPYPSVPNAGGAGAVACGFDNVMPGASIDCAMRASGTGVLDFSASGDSVLGGAYALTLEEGGTVNEGSPGDPVALDSFPFSGGALSHSYYLLTGLTPGAAYEVAFADASGQVALFLFPDDTYQMQPNICSSIFGSGAPCNVVANGSGQIYVMTSVQQENLGVTYTISVAAAELANEGSLNAPIEISGQLPYEGMVHKESSWYILTGLAAALPYTVSLSNATDDVQIHLYGPGWLVAGQPNDCQIDWANGGGDPIACVSNADGAGEIRIEVRGFDTADGATFDLDNAAGGVPNEGYFIAPVDLTGFTPWSGTVYNGPSRYKITSRAAGTDYTVEISNLSADLNLRVFDQSDLQNLLCASIQIGTVDETCVVQTTTGELYMLVSAGFNVFGSTFSMDVTP